jgi:hypothetical protein
MATQVAAQANLFKRKVRSKRVVLDWVMTGLIFASSIFCDCCARFHPLLCFRQWH